MSAATPGTGGGATDLVCGAREAVAVDAAQVVACGGDSRYRSGCCAAGSLSGWCSCECARGERDDEGDEREPRDERGERTRAWSRLGSSRSRHAGRGTGRLVSGKAGGQGRARRDEARRGGQLARLSSLAALTSEPPLGPRLHRPALSHQAPPVHPGHPMDGECAPLASPPPPPPAHLSLSLLLQLSSSSQRHAHSPTRAP